VRPDFSLCCFEVKRVLCPLLKGICFPALVVETRCHDHGPTCCCGWLVMQSVLSKWAWCVRVQRGGHLRWWGAVSGEDLAPTSTQGAGMFILMCLSWGINSLNQAMDVFFFKCTRERKRFIYWSRLAKKPLHFYEDFFASLIYKVTTFLVNFENVPICRQIYTKKDWIVYRNRMILKIPFCNKSFRPDWLRSVAPTVNTSLCPWLLCSAFWALVTFFYI